MSEATELFPTLDDWTNTEGAARALGIQASTLREWRNAGKGPPHVKINHKVFRYRISAIRAWLEAQLVSPEGQ